MHPIAVYMNYLIEDCYNEDYNPYDYENIYDDYRFLYTFSEWYFFYRKLWRLKPSKFTTYKYKLTPNKLIIGSDILGSGFILI